MDNESRNELVKKAFDALKRKFEILEIICTTYGEIVGKTSYGYYWKFCSEYQTYSLYYSGPHYQVCPEVEIEVGLLNRCQCEDIFISRSYSYPGPLLSNNKIVFLPKGTTLEQLLIQADLENLE